MGLDFGFGFWILFFFIFFGCGRMCGWGVRRHRERWRDLEGKRPTGEDRASKLESRHRRRSQAGSDEDGLLSPAVHHREDGGARAPGPLAARRSPVKDLQEKFVTGRLTLEEYERELDRLERLD